MKKNVWIFNHYATNMYFDYGGRHYCFAKYLKKAGYNPTIFCANTVHNSDKIVETNREGYIEKKDEENQIPFVFVKVPSYKGNGLSRIQNMYGFYKKIFKVSRRYAEEHEKPDIILASSVHPLTLVAGIKIAKKFGIKCICEVRDLWPESLVAYGKIKENNPLTKLLYLGEKWIYKHSDALVFTVEGGCRYLQDRKWDKESGGVVDLKRVYYINNGIDIPEVYKQRKQEHYIEKNFMSITSKKVIYTGSVRKVNHIGGILDIAIKLKNLPVTFCIFGDGDELEQLKNRKRKERIDNVIFFGKVKKKYIPSVVSNADLLLLYSQSKPRIARYGMSQNKLFDYLAAGKPIISNQNNSYSIINRYNCGIEKKFESTEEMANCIEMMLLDEKQINIWSDNASQTAEKFSFERHTKELINIIEFL